ncbi:MAG: hypothetical protein K2M91_02485 [Lachnospiraceae bacterium]|nr:hypothetical protein [Lachnospiraceae bacterium]
MICEELKDAGFEEITVKCKGKARNIYYTKEGCDAVFAVIYTTKQLKQAVVMDKSFYDGQIRDTKRKMTLKARHDTETKKLDDENKGKRYVPIFSDVIMPLHRQVMNVASGGSDIDHMTHCLSICMKEYLRECDKQQNAYNRACYVKINEAGRYFKAPCRNLGSDERIRYSLDGYSFKRNYIISPSFASFTELYEAVDNFESKYLGRFRYSPLYDFSETLYAFVAWKMLGWGNETDVTEYNRDYILRNRPDVAKYYQLGV